MNTETSLASRVLFLTIHCKRFGNLRKSSVKLDTTAQHTRFKTNQTLLDAPELDAIMKRDNAVKKQIEAFVLPYKIACAILPQESGKEVKAILTAYEKVERPQLVKAFVDAYVTRISEAKVALKDEFVEGHYPTVEEVQKEFSFDWNLFSLDLPEDMKDKAASMIEDVTKAVAEALATTAHGLTKKLADSLSMNEDGSVKKICDIHFEKLTAWLANFNVKNVINSAELKAEMDKLSGLMKGMDPELVRNNDSLRLKLHADLDAAAKSLCTMVEHKGRVFRDVPEVSNDSVL
jgi:hypothetical protein